MGSGLEVTLFKRRHTESQHTYEKMLNTTNQRNVNQNHNVTAIRMVITKKTNKQIKSVGKDVEKREPSCTLGGM